MSDNVMSVGWMVPLTNKLTEEEQEDFNEKNYAAGSNVRVNYEGTIVYTDNGGEVYGLHFEEAHQYDLSAFKIPPEKLVAEQARAYSCYWYNGTDSDMDELTLEKFLQKTGQGP